MSAMPRICRFALLLLAVTAVALSLPAQTSPGIQRSPGVPPVSMLPTSKGLAAQGTPAPGKTNSLPMTIATSPGGRYLALLNAGYGTPESGYQQSIAIYDTETRQLTDFPEPRTARLAPQIFYQGLAFSSDGRQLYASLDSLTAPEGGKPNATGNAIAVYSFHDGRLAPERLIPIPLQALAPGKTQNPVGASIPAGRAIPAPAGIAVIPARSGAPHSGHDTLLVADDLSDDALLLDPATGKVLHRFDLSTGTAVVPSSYPIAVTATRDGARGFAALWNGSAIAELDLRRGAVLRTLPLMPPVESTAPGSHPAAFAWSPDGGTLYVALANRDAVAAVHVTPQRLTVAGYFNTRLPGQTLFGAEPNALAVSPDGRRLYAANAGTDTVAVFRTSALGGTAAPRHSSAHPADLIPAEGFLPTEWLPIGLALGPPSGSAHGAQPGPAPHRQQLYIATGKGRGTGPNNTPPPASPDAPRSRRPYSYIASMLHGSLAAIDLAQLDARLPTFTREAVALNMETAAQQHIAFRSGARPIRHVIYIIKENRTYDQIFGDLPAGNGDPSLTMYGESITPNLHKLALQFGVLDNFYDSGEVSGDGHVWSNAAISSDYTEKTWQQVYHGHERNYDYEGLVENGFPVEEKIPDVNEPTSGYLWTNLARHGKSYYHFGEFIATRFCGEHQPGPPPSPQEGTPEPPPDACAHPAIRPGDAIPANYGGGASRYGWPIPLIAGSTATKPELIGHYDPAFPDFNLAFPDQLRVEEFLTHFRVWTEARAHAGTGAGAATTDPMPEFLMLRLPNDHTAGTRPGFPTPDAAVADNDLAVGRAIEAVSHSSYWEDTAFFILEDDAQDGADHVDAHRSIALVVSKYAPRQQTPLVDHAFFTTVSMIRTMEDLLGLPPMNNNDAFAPPIASVFTGAGDQPAFAADTRNRDNGLIYRGNSAQSPGAAESSRMDFRHEDRADPERLNVILWRAAKGNQPLPAALRHPHPRRKDDD